MTLFVLHVNDWLTRTICGSSLPLWNIYIYIASHIYSLKVLPLRCMYRLPGINMHISFRLACTDFLYEWIYFLFQFNAQGFRCINVSFSLGLHTQGFINIIICFPSLLLHGADFIYPCSLALYSWGYGLLKCHDNFIFCSIQLSS